MAIFIPLIFLCINLQTLRASTTVERCRQNVSDAKFIDNGYNGLVVLVGEEVDEDYGLIEDLRKLLTATSERMFQVTKRRAYIRMVSVLLPTSWGTPPPELEDIMKVKADFVHSSEKSDFRLKNRSPRSENEEVAWTLGDEEAQIDVPYVIKPTPCGYSGHYLRLTPEFVRFGDRASEQIGSPDKLLVREWAKLRWGVYDETPVFDAGSYFYTHTDLEVHPIACSMGIKGEIINTNRQKQTCSPEEALINSDCRFAPESSIDDATKKANLDESDEKNYASMMYRPDLDYVNHFCDTKSESGDDVPIEQQHNAEAPTVHNLHCQGKSVWEVIRSHPDFENGNNPSLPKDFVPPPIEFNLLQNPDRRIVLVLDISTSMKYFNRMKLMRQAASQFIETVPDNSWIGIVTFAVEGTIMSDLMQVKSNYIRQLLKNRLPNFLVTGTSIGSGIIKGLQVLKNSGPKHMRKSGGSMLVLSDGKEHNSPKINDTLQDVIDFGVRVTTIAFGAQVADDIGVLAELTGGSTYFASSGDFSDNSELRDAFLATIEDSDDGMAVVSSKSIRIRANSSEEHTFIIDETIGRDTRITVLYTEEVAPIIGLRNPVGETLWEYEEEGNPNITALFSSDEDFSTKTIQYSGKMWSGTWTLLVRNQRERQDISVDVTVFSHPVKKEESLVVSPALLCKLINFTGSESIVIYAHLNLGEFAVLDAEVEAIVTRPLSLSGSYDTATVILKDDGRGADVIPHDGIYSGYFTMFTLHGHYNVKVNAGDGGTARLDTNHILGIGRRDNELVTVSTKDLLQNSQDTKQKEKSRTRRAIKSGLLQPFRRWSTQQKEFLVNEYVAKVCADGYTPFQDSCYKFVRGPLSSFWKAKKTCADEGGFLAHVNSNQELLYLMKSVQNKDAWFGGIDNSLNKDDISVEFVAQRNRRGSATDEDLEAIADLFNLVYVNVDLRKAIESFEPDWEGLSRKEINRIIRNLGVTRTSDIARLKEEKLLSQLDLDNRILTTTDSPRAKRQAETPPMVLTETTVYETITEISATTDSPENENSTLSLAKKNPDELDFMNSGELDPECSWFNDGKIIETTGEVCTRRKAFLCEKPKLDLYPPSRITDFKVRKTIDDDVVRLVWTATGDDKTNGKASRYEIRALRTGKARSLEKDFKLGETLSASAILEGTTNDPKISGQKEELLVNMTTLSGCPPHAAIDLILVLPLRLLTPKMMLASQRDAAIELFRTLLSTFKITKYEVQVTVIAAQNQTATIIFKDSSNADEALNVIIKGVERENRRGEEIVEDDLKNILASVTDGGRQGIMKVVLSLLEEEDTGTAAVLQNVTEATVIAIGIGIENQRNIRDVVSQPKCKNAIFAANWLDLNQTAGEIADQLCYARRAEYQAWGIIALDEEGQKSETSNIATSVIINRREAVLCPPEVTEAPLPNVAGISPVTIGLAVGIPFGLLLSILGAFMLFGQVKKYRKKKRERKEREAREAEEAAAQAQRAEALKNVKLKKGVRTSMSNLLQNPKFKIKINKTAPVSRPPV